MGRKSRDKKERKAIKKCNITQHEVEDGGELYRVQEYHPEGSEHMEYDTFMQMRLVAVAPHKQVEDILTKLVSKYPTRRFAVAVHKSYVPGDHDIPIFVYPAFEEAELDSVLELVNDV